MQFTTVTATNPITPQPQATSRNPFANPNVRLWIAQGVLGALFLFSGVMKLVTSAEQAADDSGLPVVFFHFIGICEAAGGLGLVLPHLLGIARPLTAVAAIGLAVIMAGAVVVSFLVVGPVAVPVPLLAGLACLYVARGRFVRLRLTGRHIIA